MKRIRGEDQSRALEESLAHRLRTERYILCLYVTGTTSRSFRAIRNIRSLCEEKLQGRYELEVVDIYQHPAQAKPEQIIVTPTLVRRLPLPVRKIIGDLSNREQLLIGLDIFESCSPTLQPETEHGG